jgi:hypothetical protein
MAAITKPYTGLTATGTFPPVGAPGSVPFSRYAIQVKGVGAAATSWTAILEGSLDSVNWTTLISHTTPDGATQWAVDKHCTFMRLNLSTLVLGSATAVNVYITASNDS